MNNITGTV